VRHDARRQAEDAREHLDDAAARAEVAERRFWRGHRRVAEFGGDRPGLDPVHLDRGQPVGVDVAHVPHLEAGRLAGGADHLPQGRPAHAIAAGPWLAARRRRQDPPDDHAATPRGVLP